MYCTKGLAFTIRNILEGFCSGIAFSRVTGGNRGEAVRVSVCVRCRTPISI